MRKITSVLLAAILILLLSANVFAAEKAQLSFKKYPSSSGGYFVEVLLSGDSKPAIMQFCVAFDNTVVECISAVSGGAFSGNTEPTINITEGKIYFAWDSLTPVESGTVLIMEFCFKNPEKASSVYIDSKEEFLVYTENNEEIMTEKGSTEIGETKTESGNTSSEAPKTEENKNSASDEKTNQSSDESNPSKETSSGSENINEEKEPENEENSEEEKDSEDFEPEDSSKTEENENMERVPAVEVISPEKENAKTKAVIPIIIITALVVTVLLIVLAVFTKKSKRR